jgi:hypothetical protein
MKTSSKTRKFLAVAFTAAALAAGVLVTTQSANAAGHCVWNGYWNKWFCTN